LGEEVEFLLTFDQRDPIAYHARETVGMALALGSLAAQRRNLLGILARAHEVETEIGLKPLLLEIERNQRPADAVREHGPDRGIDQRRPNQISRNCKARAEQMQRRPFRQSPENDDERQQRHDRVQYSNADR